MSQTFGPYSPIRNIANIFYTSGQIGVDPDTKKASTDIGAQTERALLNLQAVLGSAGLTLNDVIKTTVYLTDMSDFTAMNEVYEQRFNAPRPARTTISVKELPRVAGETKLLVEIDAIASRGSES